MSNADEQDAAVGGPGRRVLLLGDEAKATASIAVFKSKIGYQYYAYLRFKEGGKNVKKYVGNVSAETREESLQKGWALVKRLKIVEGFGWKWVESKPLKKV